MEYKYKAWNPGKEITLRECPFCGSKPKVSHIGNEFGKTRKIEIKCSCCRATKINAAMRFNFKWLENVAAEDWNQRPGKAL